MKAIDEELRKEYPDWHDFSISALRNVLRFAQENINAR